VNVKVTPCHQPEDVAPNHVHFTVPAQNPNGCSEGGRPTSHGPRLCTAFDWFVVGVIEMASPPGWPSRSSPSIRRAKAGSSGSTPVPLTRVARRYVTRIRVR
jgi:hypothetical protein